MNRIMRFFNNSLREFVLNKNTNGNNILEYKTVKFPVKIFDMEAEFDAAACNGQEIDAPVGQYKEVLFIAKANFGYKESQISLIYSDGEECNVEFTLSD